MHTVLLFVAAAIQAEPAVEMPRVADERLTLELFAAEPAIVTPTGLAVDDDGRVLVIECHTHFRPEGYQGPPADRIRRFEDTDGDGRADRITTFFEGTQATMGLAVYRGGSVYVATRGEIFRLRDADGDGRADERTPLARLDTQSSYPHNALSGLAFDFAGNVYFGCGENEGLDYRLIGSDGTALAGGGEGGNIFRCRPDGSQLERVATGFWNPFHLAFDAFGRLFAVDNDPDSRPPCRLLHIVPRGDYGYRYRNGRKGLHPFTAWNGELPGTLPMVAGTGEAPCAVVPYESDDLPGDYRGNLLVTSWGDHRLERYRLQPRGASFTSKMEAVVVGGENFRPVGMAVAPDGSLFFSDWVDKSYTLHGKGRLWRLRAKRHDVAHNSARETAAVRWADRGEREWAVRRMPGVKDGGAAVLREFVAPDHDARVRAAALATLAAKNSAGGLAATIFDVNPPRLKPPLAESGDGPALAALAVALLPAAELDLPALAAWLDDPEIRAAALRRLFDTAARKLLLDALHDRDPFVQQAALATLARSSDTADLLKYAASNDAALRLAAVLVLRESADPRARTTLTKLLADVDPTIRFAAVQWVGEAKLLDFRTHVEQVMAQAGTRQLFEGCLATLELLDRAANPSAPKPRPDQEIAGEEYVARMLFNTATPLTVCRRALRMLRPDHPGLTRERLEELFDLNDPDLQLEVVRTLRDGALAERGRWLALLARDERRPTALRAEAILGLSPHDPAQLSALMSLATGKDVALRNEALRSLRQASLSDRQRATLRELARGDADVADLAAKVLEPAAASTLPAATALDAWLKLLDGDGDPAAGERIFFHPQATGCYKCHQLDGRGGRIGPDLSNTGRLLDRRRLIESIVEPSREVAPQFVSYTIEKTDGTVFTGLMLGQTATGEQTYADAEGRLITLKPDDIARRQPNDRSIMPDNLPHLLTPAEFRDLLAFLQQQR